MKYLVHSSETVYYITEVEADSAKDAMFKIMDGIVDVDITNSVDSDNFQVLEAELVL